MRFAILLTIVAWASTQPASAQPPAPAPAPAQTAAAAPPGNPETGKKLFVERACWECHGLAAHGGADAGPRLAGRTPAWTGFSRYVRQPTDQMIPYTSKVLSDQELADIYAWLKSIPAPPAVSAIPILKNVK